MIRPAMLVLLLLVGWGHTPPLAYGNADPGIVVDGALYWVGDPSESEQAAWTAYHLEPVLDEQEAAQLKKFAWSSVADSGTTIAGLAVCAGVRELNPLIALVPGGYLMLPLSVGAYYVAKHQASQSSRYESSYRDIRFGTAMRGVAAMSNATMIAGRM